MSHKHISDRVKQIVPSKSIAVAAKVEELRRASKDIIGMHVGEPDFATDEHIKKATADAVANNLSKYSLVDGVLELRQEICNYLNEDQGFNITPDMVLVSNGSKQIIYNIFQLFLNPGDEVIVPLPYWVTFPEAIKLAGGIPVFIGCEESLLPDVADIEKKITSKTRMIILNSPGNPSGRVIPPDYVEKVGQLALKNNILIMSDEAYDELTFGSPFKSPFTYDTEWAKLVLPVKSFSKSFCMTGYRLGYVISNPETINEMRKFQGHLNGNPCTFAQYGAIAALRENRQELLKKRRDIFKNRRDLAWDLASKLFDFDRPEGAFYLFPDVTKYLQSDLKTSQDLCIYLLERAGVALLPGESFGLAGHIRIAFATSEDMIRKAFERIESALKELK